MLCLHLTKLVEAHQPRSGTPSGGLRTGRAALVRKQAILSITPLSLGIALLLLLWCVSFIDPGVRLSVTRSTPVVVFRLAQWGIRSHVGCISMWDQSGQYLWAAEAGRKAREGPEARRARVTKFPYGTAPAGMRQIFPYHCQSPRALVAGDTVFMEVRYANDNFCPHVGTGRFVFTVRDDRLVCIRYPGDSPVLPKNYPIQKEIHEPNSVVCP